ncbi:MAG: ABC transporter permease subunit [Pleurocapsa minor GSE-CHR-MK-17-07R]|jgi:ABC-type sugar transport system permease subunit|nr:ABC transporter permease subunit [Pleurocapsa minor GSE-CHR-MK 17-07R]
MDVAAQARLDNLLWAAATVIFIAAGSVLLGLLARGGARLARLSDAEGRKIFWGVFFASPWIIGFFIFVVGPALASLLYSFTDYKLGDSMNFVGLDNYRELLLGEGAHGRRFAGAMYNSFYYAIIGVPLQILTALAMALLLNQALRGVRFFRLIFYLPVILAGGPAILLAWRYMLASNGGFINEAMSAAGNAFFLFDWLKRTFIFLVEGFNGFYSGIVRGDPIGPLKYFIPALIAVLFLSTMLRGEWSDSRRSRLLRVSEIVGAVLGMVLVARGLIALPIDPFLIVGIGLILAAGALSAHRNASPRAATAYLVSGIVLSVGAALMAIATPSAEDGSAFSALPYLLASALVAAVFAGALVASQARRASVLLIGLAAGSLAVLVHLSAGQFDQGQLGLIFQYLTFQSAIAQPGDLAYLQETFPQASLSAFWIWGGMIAFFGVLIALNGGNAKLQRWLIVGGTVVFALLAVNSLLDTLRYFSAFNDVAAAAGVQNYHFSLFRQATQVFPDSQRVPLWMSSELWSKPSLILITMWSSGAGMLIFLAALKGIPRVFYEAADVDGASRVQQFFKITLPLISPAMFYNIVIGVIAALQTFESIYILQTPTTQDSLASAAYFLFVRTFRQLAIGEGAAVSWILAAIIVFLTVLQFRYSRWVNYES